MRGKINKSLSTIPWFDLQILNNFYSLVHDRLFLSPDPRQISLKTSPCEFIWDSIETVVFAIKCCWGWWGSLNTFVPYNHLNLILIHDATFVIAFRFQLDSPPSPIPWNPTNFFVFLNIQLEFPQVLILSLKHLNVKAFM